MRYGSRFIAVVLGLLLAISSASANSVFSVDITIDENGNGSLANSSGFSSPLQSFSVQDPGPGGLAGALTYDMLNPPGITAGDLILLEPGAVGTISDIIRFNTTSPTGGTGSIVFYSDNADGVDALADIGFPLALYANNLTVFEVGPEGSNGFTYTPTAGQPGFVTGAGGPITYHIISDAASVPTPAAAWGGAVLLVILFVGRSKLVAKQA